MLIHFINLCININYFIYITYAETILTYIHICSCVCMYTCARTCIYTYMHAYIVE